MARETYYVHLHKKEISQGETPNEHKLTIHATKEEVSTLRNLFSNIQSADFSTFFRANVPIKPYHNAASSDDFDASYTKVAKMLYDLGDEHTKQFIRESGLIGQRPINKEYTYPDPEHDGGKQA